MDRERLPMVERGVFVWSQIADDCLLVKSEQAPLPINFSSLTTGSKISQRQFYNFCPTNPDLRIERNASGAVIVMPPAFADIGNRNSRVSGQLFVWPDANGPGEAFDSSSGFTLPNGAG